MIAFARKILMVLWMLPTLAKAQPVVFPERFHREDEGNITGNCWYLEDRQNASVEQVKNYAPGLWKSNKGKFTFHQGISPHAYWIRFQIQTREVNSPLYYLQLSNRGLNVTELFIESEGNIKSFGKTGDRYPFSQRPYPSPNFTFPIELVANKTLTCYLYCSKKNENLNLKLRIFSASKLARQEEKSRIFIGLLTGILLMAFIVSFILLGIFK